MTTATAAPPLPDRQAGTRPRRQAPMQQAPKAAPAPRVTFGSVRSGGGHRIVLYGPGGIGKTTLAAIAPGPVAFFDLDDSLGVLAGQLPDVDVRPVSGASTWQDIRGALHAPGWDAPSGGGGGIKTIVIDSATRAEELATDWVIANVPHDQNRRIERVEDYGYGKGYRHIYDTFLTLLADLDAHVRAGRNVILVAHEATEKHPNPQGEDWLRSEPRLQHTSKNSIRERARDWCDHLLFVGYDVEVKDGRGRSSGTRTLWPTEQPHCMAKSRTLADPVEVIKHDATIWNLIFGQKGDK